MKKLVRRMSALRMRVPSLANMAQQEPNGDISYLPTGAAEGKTLSSSAQNQ